jgi:nucleoside-diphosphate-sugar epimerase
MKLIVIGGTGLIGSQVVQKLTAAGHQAASSREPYTGACGRLQRVRAQWQPRLATGDQGA